MFSDGTVIIVIRNLFDILLKIKTDHFGVQMVRYGVVTVACFTIDFAGLYLLTEFAGLNYLVSATISFVIGTCVNYLFSIAWVFNQNRFDCRSIEFTGFVLIGVAGMGLNMGLVWFFTDVVGLYYLWSRCFSAVIGFFTKYLARKYALFTRPSGVRS